MNFVEILILWCVVVAVASSFFSVWIGHYRLKSAKVLKACTEIPSYEDANKSVTMMVSHIFERMKAVGFPAIHRDGKHEFTLLNTFGICDSPDIIKFFRMAHAAGFEIVLRPRKVGRPGGGEMDGDEFVSSSRPSDYVALDED